MIHQADGGREEEWAGHQQGHGIRPSQYILHCLAQDLQDSRARIPSGAGSDGGACGEGRKKGKRRNEQRSDLSFQMRHGLMQD
ncbi:hypothetical protein EYF80_007037 [Liparis tanakae]|uniref:Uncharacterized protein n=1 Tax=Liparis tanakae TaxID=230148 RepID=A0A4Z2IY37_9TELE|nr:hypothetical protein EYF80_007037 [Liparis tanakae]